MKGYLQKKRLIRERLGEFGRLDESSYLDELIFCTLTPQSNAQKCWSAVLELKKLENRNKHNIAKILKGRTRFHNKKAEYILGNIKNWEKVRLMLNNPDVFELRNRLAREVYGFGLKEAGHFLRNIGKSENKIAILDRHIMRNLKEFEVVHSEKIKNAKHYLEIEEKFLEFSLELGIPIDEMDLLFWSRENGEIFK